MYRSLFYVAVTFRYEARVRFKETSDLDCITARSSTNQPCMPAILSIGEALASKDLSVRIDVRSPAEFAQGHIPEALSIPLLSNEERHDVGLCYAEKGKDAALKLGLQRVGPKMSTFIETLETFVGPPSSSTFVQVYCWRGGMRSASMAWLFETAGWRTATIRKGYKAWRNEARLIIEQPRLYRILCGHTGSGKTDVLAQLRERQEQVVDLEDLAGHRGSAFGWLGRSERPGQEHFENLLAVALLPLNTQRPIWLEDESRRIGAINIPMALWLQMIDAEVVRMHIPIERRLDNLVRDYGAFSIEELREGIQRISRKLGSEQTKLALDALDAGDIRGAAARTLAYYDKYYRRGMDAHSQKPLAIIESSEYRAEFLADEVLKAVCSD